MRLACVTDIHGNLAALEAVVADIARRAAARPFDRIVNLGDSLSGPLLPRETATFLMAQDWLHLSGNHERQILRHGPAGREASDAYAHARLTASQLAWIATLKDTARLDGDTFVCHGSPRSDLEYLLETVDPDGRRAATIAEVDERLGAVGGSLVVCGHTHVPRVVAVGDGRTVVNPGSVGLPAFDDERPWYHAVENHAPHARYAVVEQVDGTWVVDLVAIPYDHEAMARLADERGRLEWALALRTGTVAQAARRGLPPAWDGR